MENKKSGRIILQAKDIIKQYKQYDSVVTAVDRATFEVSDGEFVAIIGASGSGKSTLLHICAGLDRPNSGTVSVRATSLPRWAPTSSPSFGATISG